MKKHKSEKTNQTPTTNGNAEVFVLSPDILAKLGINIQNSLVQSPGTNLAIGSDHNPVLQTPKCVNEGKDGSSIIKTASLMKESVFLSPTFNETTSNVTPDEMPLFINDLVSSNGTSFPTSDHAHYSNSTNLHKDSKSKEIIAEVPENTFAKTNYDTTIKQEDFASYELIKEYKVDNEHGNLILTNISYGKTNDVGSGSIEKLNATSPIKQLTDTINISNEKSLSDVTHTKIKKCDPPNKIKIISEEVIIDLTQLKEITNLKSSNDATLIPITVDTLVTGKFVHNNSTGIKNISRHVTEQVIDQPLVSNNSDSDGNIQFMQVSSEMSGENIILSSLDDVTEENNKIAVKDGGVHAFPDLPLTDLIRVKVQPDENNFSPMTISSLEKTVAGSEIYENEIETITPTDITNVVKQWNGDIKSLEPNNGTQNGIDRVLKIHNTEYCYEISETLTLPNIQSHKHSNSVETADEKNKILSSSIIKQHDCEGPKGAKSPDAKIGSVDRVQEISHYLKQFTDKIKNIRKNRTVNGKIITKSKVDFIKSKLCPQEFEVFDETQTLKDENMLSKICKTYQRTAMPRQIPASVTMSQNNNIDLFQLSHGLQKKLQDIRAENLNDFCNCYDFGQLTYYDSEMIYEHIHFWHGKNIVCEPEIIYSIYNDNYTISKQNTDLIRDERVNLHGDYNTFSRNNICWNDITSESSLIDVKSSTNVLHDKQTSIQSNTIIETSDKSNSPVLEILENKIHRNPDITKTIRSVKSSIMEQISGPYIPESKSNIKCGVCHKFISEAGWESHKEIEHNSKAWKADQKSEKANCSTDSEYSYFGQGTRPTGNSTNSATDPTSSSVHKSKILLPGTTTSSALTMNSARNIDISPTNNRLTSEIEADVSFFNKQITTNVENDIDSISSNRSMAIENVDNLTSISNSAQNDNAPPSMHNLMNKTNIKSDKMMYSSTGHSSTIEISEPQRSTNNPIIRKLSTEINNVPNCYISKKGKIDESSRCSLSKLEEPSILNMRSDESLISKSSETSKIKESAVSLKSSKSNKKITESLKSTKRPSNTDSNILLKKIKLEERDASSRNKSYKTLITDIIVKSNKMPESGDHPELSKNHRIGQLNEMPILENIPIIDVPSNSEFASHADYNDFSKYNALSKSSSEPVKISYTAESSISKDLPMRITNNYTMNPEESNVMEIEVPIFISKISKCGVCDEDVETEQWSDHIGKEHNYIAWRHGERPLDVKDDGKVKNHLQLIAKQIGGLVCSKCGLVRKFAKSYLRHIKTCNGDETMDVSTSSMELNSTQELGVDSELPTSRKSRMARNSAVQPVLVTCGVCSNVVDDNSWIEHIKVEHKYLAWKDGENPINLNSEDEVKEHLNKIAKHYGLQCIKCGGSWRYVKKYLVHEQLCSLQDKNISEYECGVCHQKGNGNEWREHAMNNHYNIAWIVGETPIDLKNPTVIEKCLKEYKLKYTLICKICQAARASIQGFYSHIMTCGKTEEEIDAIRDVCEICNNKYLCVYKKQHMNTHKDQDGTDPVKVRTKKTKEDLDADEYEPQSPEECDKKPVKNAKRKRTSDAADIKPSFLQLYQNSSSGDKVEVELQSLLKCGVCKLDVVAKDWINHIQRVHGYLAWIDGGDPLDVENPEEVRKHLQKVVNTVGELVCNMCGESRKYEHAYRQHVRACEASGYKVEITVPVELSLDEYECGVCKKRGDRREWKEHAMKKHYNIAWMAGEMPINLRNPYAVEKYLKEYQTKYPLICKTCKTARSSCYGFYAHILQCGKTEEELEAVHNVCDICHNKYLCIYRNQHMAMHRDQEYKRDLKELQNAQKATKEAQRQKRDAQPAGKRRAAEKAKMVIEKYTSNAEGKPVCSCGVMFENSEEMSSHRCNARDGNDSDVSVKMEPESEESDSDVDSNVSVEEDPRQLKKRSRQGEGTTKITRMSYKITNYTSYLVQGFKDFVKLHYTNESLFDDWRNTEYNVVNPDELSKYLPSLMESCKVRNGAGEWMTYKRFEATKSKGVCIFTGGTVQCMSWVPAPEAAPEQSHYLAVVAHRGPDVPRSSPSDRPRDCALLQIWRFGTFTICPQLTLALALDYGVVWAMDWCPSGARDLPPTDTVDPRPHMDPKVPDMDPAEPPMDSTVSPNTPPPRLGLVAIACSNGSAYIFPVPYPQSDKTEIEDIVYKLKPAAELRFSMSSERRTYQATSIHWSQQKGHEIIIVGYSDGSTALYDLNTDSPLLKASENGVTILYPFQDRLSENSPITGTVLTASSEASHAAGAVGTASSTGGTLRAPAHAAPAARCHLPAIAAAPSPLWPSFYLYGDQHFTTNSITELEWWGGGRRLGAARAGASCLLCGRSAALTAPAVRLLRAHPVYPDLKKLIVATLLMVPLGQKGKRKQINDDLSVLVEPLTYEDAVSKYGLELSYVARNDQLLAQKLCSENENSPERFPLSDIVSAAFCPSSRYHEKLALATHAGLIFLINT